MRIVLYVEEFPSSFHFTRSYGHLIHHYLIIFHWQVYSVKHVRATVQCVSFTSLELRFSLCDLHAWHTSRTSSDILDPITLSKFLWQVYFTEVLKTEATQGLDLCFLARFEHDVQLLDPLRVLLHEGFIE